MAYGGKVPEESSVERRPRWARPRRGVRPEYVLACLITLLLSRDLAIAGELIVTLTPHQARQGQVLLLRVSGIEKATHLSGAFGDQALSFFSSPDGQGFAALVGVDLEERPGRRSLQLDLMDALGNRYRGYRTVDVAKAKFPIQRLTMPKELVELDAETMKRVEQEVERLKAVWADPTPEKLWRGSFTLPVNRGRRPSGFGARRIINGEERSRHTGADIEAPLGTPVLAANTGRVALVDEHFFPGKLVVLDHGLGLYTMYFHLQEALVEAGQLVEKGQQIGKVGTTGRASGPHLHFGARLNGARVDPLSLLALPLNP